VKAVDWVVAYLLRQGWRRGVVGGSRVWTAAGGVAVVGWLARRALKREPDVVFLERLRPGETFRITNEPLQ
jgi:hypothetical protein